MLLSLILALAAALYLFELYGNHIQKGSQDGWKFSGKPLPVTKYPMPIMDHVGTLGLTLPNLRYRGPAPWETSYKKNSGDYELSSDQFGFFNRHDLKRLKHKSPNEFRIILVGGSGAQGHGASSNGKMFHNLLEEGLNKQFKSDGVSIKVFNLAVAGFEAYLFPSLLKNIGHKIQPDLILAYTGANDTYQIAAGGAFFQTFCRPIMGYYLRANHIIPEQLSLLVEYFPTVSLRFGLTRIIKQIFFEGFYKKRALKVCTKSFGINDTSSRGLSKQIFEKVSKPIFVKSFKEIKRDFCGVPIFLAWQAIHKGERYIYNTMVGLNVPNYRSALSMSAITKMGANLDRTINKEIFFMVAPPTESWSKNDIIKQGTQLKNPSVVLNFNDLQKIGPLKNLVINFTVNLGNSFSQVFQVNFQDLLTQKNTGNGIDIYTKFYQYIRKELEGYFNDGWIFLNTDRILNSNSYSNLVEQNAISIHLHDKGHEALSQLLQLHVRDVITKLRSGDSTPKCP
ncbi:MAG: hypothetical protein CMM37_10280 [Rhodospirillaceae bacterium]|nr:hypothetical protein [Rhodospirillaceae bacterium]